MEDNIFLNEAHGMSGLTDGQEMALSMLMAISGMLSTLGSSTIVYKVVKNFRKATPYDRLLFGLSSCDIVASLTYALSPFLLPKGTSHRVWAIGNVSTCSMLGFLTTFAFSAVWYNCMLSFYYLLTVRFGVKRDVFAKRYEIWMHILSLAFNIASSSYGAIVDMYGELELNLGCWISYYPKGCQETDTCVGSYYGWAFAGLPIIFTMFAIPINNLIIYCHVRRMLNKASTDDDQEERHLRHQAQIREVSSQGFLYVGTFFLCMLPAVIVRVLEAEPVLLSAEDEPQFFWLLALNNFLLPFQGFLNMFVYTRPNYIRVRGANPEQTALWAHKKACLESDIPRLTESRWSMNTNQTGGSSRRLKVQRSAKSKSKSKSMSSGSAFTSDLAMVVEDSEEDQGSSAFAKRPSFWANLKIGSAEMEVGQSVAGEHMTTRPIEEKSVDVGDTITELVGNDNNNLLTRPEPKHSELHSNFAAMPNGSITEEEQKVESYNMQEVTSEGSSLCSDFEEMLNECGTNDTEDDARK